MNCYGLFRCENILSGLRVAFVFLALAVGTWIIFKLLLKSPHKKSHLTFAKWLSEN